MSVMLPSATAEYPNRKVPNCSLQQTGRCLIQIMAGWGGVAIVEHTDLQAGICT
jgi:hypothetical protein